jgi:hypothetical protein
VSALARFVVARDAANLSATLEPTVAQWGSSPSSLFTLYIEGLLRTCSVPVDTELLCRLTNLQIEALSHFYLDSNPTYFPLLHLLLVVLCAQEIVEDCTRKQGQHI